LSFFVETLIAGLLAGVMYSLVAIGFVLIYKASGVFNFAQGSMVLFAALFFVTILEHGIPFWACFVITLCIMSFGAILVERLVLRPLVNSSIITLFMATLGLSFVIEGLAQGFMGTSVHNLDIGIDDVPYILGDIFISQFDIFSAIVAGTLVIGLSIFFSKTRVGILLRAVADDTLAAQSIGIRLPNIARTIWIVAGFVALVTGLLWGARQGVQFALSLSALKALPVLIIGGFTSIRGAILGGLLIGAGEVLADVYIGPILGGGISAWFAYLVAVLFLMIRPTGMFGDPTIDRV
jgi:branched-chain amino acid transport system permease protein